MPNSLKFSNVNKREYCRKIKTAKAQKWLWLIIDDFSETLKSPNMRQNLK